MTKIGFSGGIDAGGTTFKCGVASGNGEIIAKQRVDVTTPIETVDQCLKFFRQYDLSSFGIASFGPVDVDKSSPHYGRILKTPKPHWSHFSLKSAFEAELNFNVVVDSDVNGALLAEVTSGAARGISSAAYITVGTGIGAGIMSLGEILGRPYHPEFGHIAVKKHDVDRDFPGVCPFHGDCLEGLTSVTALKKRWGDPIDWGANHQGWDVAANYLAQACASLVLTLRLERIIIGGGLMLAENMLPKIQTEFESQLNGYLGDCIPTADNLICTPYHGDDAGLHGAILLGRQVADS